MSKAKYRDISFNFLANPINGDISTVSNENSIIQSIKNILLTDSFEVPFNSSFSGNVNSLLFEPVSPITKSILKDRIKQAIENFEPRIILQNVDVSESADENSYNVTITFTSRLSEQQEKIAFFLERLQ